MLGAEFLPGMTLKSRPGEARRAPHTGAPLASPGCISHSGPVPESRTAHTAYPSGVIRSPAPSRAMPPSAPSYPESCAGREAATMAGAVLLASSAALPSRDTASYAAYGPGPVAAPDGDKCASMRAVAVFSGNAHITVVRPVCAANGVATGFASGFGGRWAGPEANHRADSSSARPSACAANSSRRRPLPKKTTACGPLPDERTVSARAAASSAHVPPGPDRPVVVSGTGETRRASAPVNPRKNGAGAGGTATVPLAGP